MIEGFSPEIAKELQKSQKEKENTVSGCKLEVKDDTVLVKIPITVNDYKTYLFSKKDVKHMFETLYTS